MQTGISGNTLIYTLVPFTILIFRLITSSAVVSCFALSRTPFPLMRMPQSPYASVVPFVEPPVGIGTRPLCLLMLWMFFGAKFPRLRVIVRFTVGNRGRDHGADLERRESISRRWAPCDVGILSSSSVLGVYSPTLPVRPDYAGESTLSFFIVLAHDTRC